MLHKALLSQLGVIDIERREPKAQDVAIDVLYCGVCHSDIHTVRSEWPGTIYPCVPGHEIIGRVASVGQKVSKFKVGDLVGVGCLVGSCHKFKDINEAYERTVKGDVKYRFVIDMSTLG